MADLSGGDTTTIAPYREAESALGYMAVSPDGSLAAHGDRWVLRKAVEPPSGSAAVALPERLILVENWFEEHRGRTGESR